MEDPYEILQVNRNALPQDIKKSYRRLAAQWHPDKNPDRQEEAHAQSQKIRSAYDLLMDAEKRAAYDTRRRTHLVSDPEQAARSLWNHHLELIK